jgi:hypothetical protein
MCLFVFLTTITIFTPDGSRDEVVHRIRGLEYVNFCRHRDAAVRTE